MSISITSQSFTLAAATPTPLVLTNPGRKILRLDVTGVNPATFKFGVAPASAIDGIPFAAAPSVGTPGGNIFLSEGDAPIDAVYAYSTLGTTVTVSEGIEYA